MDRINFLVEGTEVKAQELHKKLAGLQRLTSLKFSSAYRSTSTEAVEVIITGIPPIHLLIVKIA